MADQNASDKTCSPTRRDFVKSTAVAVGAAAAASLVVPSSVHAQGSSVVKIGLVGCGGRGKGAAGNALRADPNNKLVALGDMFPDKLAEGYDFLKPEFAAQMDIPNDRRFTGWDAYKGVIESSDVVLLATPPHFRPMHLAAVAAAGKHCFCEKPVGVDPVGVRNVMETSKIFQQKNLNLVSGLCYRYDKAKQQIVEMIHGGAIGDIRAIQANYLTGPLWSNPRKPGWSDMEWQLRNWLYFVWLSGDHIVEQHIHSIDKAMWVMKDEPPVKVISSGGRVQRTAPEFGNEYDHFASIFEWENGVKCYSHCRQWVDCETDVSDIIFGSEGTANLMTHRITGKTTKKVKPTPDFYDAEHRELFSAIRGGKVINNGDYMCKSTMTAIMARLAAYTGKSVTWEQVMSSQLNLTPPKYEMGPLAVAPVAVPGQVKLV